MTKSIITKMALIVIACVLGCWSANAEGLEDYSLQEKTALRSIAQIRAAQTDHHANSKAHTFASSLKELYSGEKTNGLSFIDKELSTGTKDGYIFRFRVKDESEYDGLERWRWWSVEAKPANYGEDGAKKSFYCDLSGRIRAEDIGGDWGTMDMKAVPEQDIAKLKEEFTSQATGERVTREKADFEVYVQKAKEKNSHIKKREPQKESEFKLKFFPGYGNAFSKIREYFDESGNRIWSKYGIPQSEVTYFKDKTLAQWEDEARLYAEEIRRSLSSQKTGTLKVKFCSAAGYKCRDINWDREIDTRWGTKIKLYGNPKATLFPADPVLMQQIADIFISNPRPELTEPWDLLRKVFNDYEESGRFRSLVKEGICNLDDETAIFEDIPEGEWIVYARFECEDEYWEELYQKQNLSIYNWYRFHPAFCDVWIEFVNIEADKQIFKKLTFGSSLDHVIYTDPGYWY